MIDLNELPDTIGEMVEEEIRKSTAHAPAAEEGEPGGAPPQPGQSASTEESQSEDELAQQLSDLRTGIGKLNTTAALLRGDLFEINGWLDCLLDGKGTPDKAARENQAGTSRSCKWLQGFGTAVILSPVIFGLGALAARGIGSLAGSWSMPADWLVGALLCVAAGLLLLCLAWDSRLLKKIWEWPFYEEEWPEGDKTSFVEAESSKKKEQKS